MRTVVKSVTLFDLSAITGAGLAAASSCRLVGRASHFKLQNAASIAKNILTTEAIVAEAPEKQPAAMGGGMPDMGGMM
jgi:hypothetical protein